nr:MAG TPA: Protein of unknown function (DUF1192) [Caudoviricetes sp.]
MDKLVQKVNYNLPNSPAQQLYMYGEASVEANHAMQEPLQKLYQYENQPDMREKIREYIDELDTEIKRCESELILINSSYTQSCEPKNPQVGEVWIGHSDNKYELQSRINALIEVKNDLLGRLEEVV